MLLLATTLRPWPPRRKPRHPWDSEGGVPDHRVHDRVFDNLPSDVVGRRRVVRPDHGPD